MPNWIAKLNCWSEQNLPNQIWFAKPNCHIDLAELIWHTKSSNLLLTLPEWIYPFLASIFCTILLVI
jgi:hypothetical protein